MRILEATYGTSDSAVDVTAQLQELARKGCLLFTVSNSLFGDPCPNQPKTLRFTYQLPEDDRHYTDEVPEHQLVSLPDPGVKTRTDRGLPTRRSWLMDVRGALQRALTGG